MKQIVCQFSVPDLAYQSGISEISWALEGAPGVEEYEIDFAHRFVKVVLNDPDGEEDVKARLSSAGFPVLT